MINVIKDYIEHLSKEIKLDNYTEHTFRPALKRFIETINKDLVAINEPQRTSAGAPDLLILNKSTPIGYIETKPLGNNLSLLEKSEQIIRYRAGLPNFILTNYTEFRWYVNGELKLKSSIVSLDERNNEMQLDHKNLQNFDKLITHFLDFNSEISNPEELAKRIALYASYIRKELLLLLTGYSDEVAFLKQQLEGFRMILLEDLNEEKLADMYAQTICYGLFSARLTIPENQILNLHSASYAIPQTNPFLRKMFNQIVGPDLNNDITWLIDDLIKLLNSINLTRTLHDTNLSEDPIVYFYERFLYYYDDTIRTVRGVYFTPKSVVLYIVRSINQILISKFKLNAGLADASKVQVGNNDELHRVQILDPATGTGTFLNEILEEIYKEFKDNKGMWSRYVYEHLLQRIYGFEILMAPYTVAHMKLSQKLKDLGYNIAENERLRIFLTNTLEEAYEMVKQPLFSYWLTEEANAAKDVKTNIPVMVILGNPPYKGHSANNNEWIRRLVQDYYFINRLPLQERNKKWLQNDYVKFIRFGQWKIDHTGSGVLAFITPHSYLDGPIFRGMRKSLMKSFDEIYILNLHGNARRHTKTPEGDLDENVFDITEGVVISIFIKFNKTEDSSAKVFYNELWGKRLEKYNSLESNTIETINWKELLPVEPFYLFIPHDLNYYEEYKKGWKVTDIFNVNSVGIVTARDKFTINWTKEDVWRKINDFVALDTEKVREKYNLPNDSQEWKITFAQKDIDDSGINKDLIRPILYRPFDIRFTYYSGKSKGFICRPRTKIMENFNNDKNIGLITSRLTKGESFHHAFITREITDAVFLSSKSSNNAFVFPLYFTYEQGGMVENLKPDHNFNECFIEYLEKRLRLDLINDYRKQSQGFRPEDIMGYIYALLYSEKYRDRYKDYLRVDYPHIQFTRKKDLFFTISQLGIELINLHTFKKHLETNVNFPKEGTNIINKIDYLESSKRVLINENQYFENVESVVWNYKIGGYQVCNKWLKSRKNRLLSFDDLKQFQQMVEIINNTIKIQKKIDISITSNGGWPIQ